MRVASFLAVLWWVLAGFAGTTLPAWAGPQLAQRWQNINAPRFQHLNFDPNLSQSVTNAIIEDRDGFLWIGTQGGLLRWDGYRSKLYLPKEGDPHQLPDNWVQVLHLGPDGRMWVGTAGGGLAWYNREQDNFTRIPVGPNGSSHVGINALADDGRGGLWIATEGGLDHLDANGRASHVRHVESDPASLPSDNVSEVLSVKGELWVGTSRGLVHRPLHDLSQSGFVNVPLADYGAEGVHSLLHASDGRLWIGTRNRGALVLEPGARQARYTLQTNAKALGEWIYKMIEVRPGEIWLGTYGVGIIVVDSKSGQYSTIHHDPRVENSLSDDSIWGFYKGRGGLIWIGSNRGLDWYDSGQNAFVTVAGVTPLGGAAVEQKYIADRDVMSVAAMPDGRIWLGLRNNGIDIFDPVQGRVAAVRPDSQHPQRALQRDSVFTMVPGRDGSVMLGTNRGLYRSDAKGQNLTRLTLSGRSELESVRALNQFGEQWWVGGDIDGLWRWPQAWQDGAPKLSDQRISVFEPGRGGRSTGIWIGTWNGLNWFDGNKARIIAADPADPAALGSGGITSLLTDKRGRLWVGTQGAGVHLLVSGTSAELNPATSALRFRRFGMSQGLPNANVSALLEDEDGQIWVSTDNGLAVIDPLTFAVRTYGRADGLIVNGYWSNSAAKTAQGELLFGGVGGLTVVRPRLVREWHYQPPLVITEVRIAGKPVLSAPFNQTNPAPLSLTQQNNQIAVEFAALDFSAAEQNRYAYRLEGFDPTWIETDASRRVAAYTNLPPGEYRLRIRGSNRNGVWNPQERVLQIKIIASWYQTGWWYALQCALVVMAAMLLVQARTRYLQRRQRKLEQEVASRTAELHEKQAQLMQQEKLAALGGLVTGVAHEINTPLGVVLSAMSGAMGALQRIAASLASERASKSELEAATRDGIEYIDLAISNGSRTAALVDSFNAMASRFESDRVDQLDLPLYLAEVAELVRADLLHDGHQLQIEASPGLTLATIPAALSEVLMRILANVRDHAFADGRQGCLTLKAWASGQQVCIEIIDDGVGIAAQHLSQVFDPFFTTRRGAGGHVGLGLTVAHSHLTQRLQARIEIKSEAGQGTRVLITLPAAGPDNPVQAPG